LLADEPTGNLDADLTLDILTLLSDANARGTTVVVATHDQHLLASHPRRTLVLSGGRVVAGGDGISLADTQAGSGGISSAGTRENR
jgi:cell division transport system ATP-binding protein